MKLFTFHLSLLTLLLTSCEQLRTERALNEWRTGRAEYLRVYAKEIKECPTLAQLP